MKKFISIISVIIFAVTPFTFVSCDEDYEIADTLWGVWEGKMYVQSTWNGQTYMSSYSVIQFDRAPNHYDSGTGYWIDYYSGAPWDYFASHIDWIVSNGTIKIYSYEDDSYYYIYDYSLSDNHFSGVIDSEYGDPMEFYLFTRLGLGLFKSCRRTTACQNNWKGSRIDDNIMLNIV